MRNKLKILLLIFITATACTSCSSCADKVKNYASPASEKQEQPQGLNPNHRFVFTDCGMTYNEQTFMIGESIHKMVELFGQYDRVPEQGVYIWDSIGIKITTWSPENPETDKVNNIYIYWNLDMSQDSYRTRNPEVIEMRKEMVERSPKKFLHGNILVDGVALGRGMNIKDFLPKSKLDWSNDPFPVLYDVRLRKCDYQNIFESETYEIGYCIRITDDYSDIEQFMISRIIKEPGIYIDDYKYERN